MHISTIYIAAPDDEKDNVVDMADVLRGMGYSVKHGFNLKYWLNDRHKDCPGQVWLDQKHDFINSVETEILSNSKIFYYSHGSSLSNNIITERRVKRAGLFDTGNDVFFKQYRVSFL